MSQAPDHNLPLMQRDHEPGALISESEVFAMQVKDPEDGRWYEFLMPCEDRDQLTRIQVHRLHDPQHPGERRRILRRVVQIWVEEVEGDGEGETSAEALIARNDANTERLLKKDQQPGT